MFRLNRWHFLVVLLATRPTVAQEPTASSETVADLEGQTEGLLEELRSGRREADDLVARYEAADGEERVILRSQIRRIRARLRDAVDSLVSHIAELEAAGIDPTGPRVEVVSLLDGVDDFLRDDLLLMREQVEALRAGRRELAADELLGREQDLSPQSASSSARSAEFTFPSPSKSAGQAKQLAETHSEPAP